MHAYIEVPSAVGLSEGRKGKQVKAFCRREGATAFSRHCGVASSLLREPVWRALRGDSATVLTGGSTQEEWV